MVTCVACNNQFQFATISLVTYLFRNHNCEPWNKPVKGNLAGEIKMPEKMFAMIKQSL